MLEGKCLKCGARYCGWALKSPRNQTCEFCGTALQIVDERGMTYSGYSPFTAEEYRVQASRYRRSPEIPPYLYK